MQCSQRGFYHVAVSRKFTIQMRTIETHVDAWFWFWLFYDMVKVRYIEDFNDNGQWMCARGTNCCAITKESIKILLFVRWKLKHEYVVEFFPICQPMRSRLETWFVNISRRITERSEKKRSEYNVMQCSVIMSKWLMNGWRWRWGLR